LGYYSSLDETKKLFMRWTIRNQGEIYPWLELMWMPLIPIPLPLIPFQYDEVYSSYTSWYGDYDKLPEILTDIENNIQEAYGIGYEVWTIPLKGARTYLDDHSYISGCGAQNLLECMRDQNINKFGWFLIAKSVAYMVVGEVHEKHCHISVEGITGSIPNNFPFISIDDIGRVMLEPLSVKRWTVKDRIKEWRKSISGNLWLEDLPDEVLAPFPSAQIVGYLGERPRPRSYDTPFRARGLTVLEIINSYESSEVPPLIKNTTLICCHISSAPRGLNDFKEMKIIWMKLNTLILPLYPIHDLTVVLFSIDCYVNQSKSYRIGIKQ
jgi:hypothetical protein